MTFFYYKDAADEWRWYLEAANGKTIADSGEGYKNEADCRSAIELVRGVDGTVAVIKLPRR